ncbi:vitamin B12 dependent-methionine synthase activation domain-containing protein [Dysgonomonas sp. 511]|uniref:vitamin B12 dependent-methionine synthase activation domain-containing protein n=1 Tax=Dysgonomonas sp. 511 TaxID=2302930 RepID=UPI0013D0E8F6|nr:vitamin B12 dependent-methionine synthase activation domain-containing protein [Dysgonomonas sp. 511]NDV79721.1 hypothetical protein [Dysgonomonas sp. 511]
MPKSGFQSYSFSFREVAPSKDDILNFIHAEGSDESHPVNIITTELLDLLSRSENQIKGGYIIKEITSLQVKEGKLGIGNHILDIGAQIASYVREASHIALFLCTAGDVFTSLSKYYNDKGDYLEAFTADAIGSLTVENAMDKVQEQLSSSLLNSGLSISNRYSPGYCNWILAGQQSLFNLIGENPTGITLSDSSLMNPIKSVSGIIGIGKEMKKRDYGCKICNNHTCIYRKIISNQ